MFKNILKSLLVALCVFIAHTAVAEEHLSSDQVAIKSIINYLNEDSNIENSHFSVIIEKEEDEEADEVVERRHWIHTHHTVEKEIIKIKFPDVPNLTKNDQTISLSSAYHHVVYTLTSFIPSKKIDNANDLFQNILSSFTQYPHTLGKYDIDRKNGISTLELKTVNIETGVSERIKYFITPKNVYILETIYRHGANEHHSQFFNSFEILR